MRNSSAGNGNQVSAKMSPHPENVRKRKKLKIKFRSIWPLLDSTRIQNIFKIRQFLVQISAHFSGFHLSECIKKVIKQTLVSQMFDNTKVVAITMR